MKCIGCGSSLTGRQRKWCSLDCKNIYYVSKNRQGNKIKAIEYLGGSCERCSWSEHPAGLAFHHRDPSTKEFGISAKGNTRSWEKIKEEVDKCHLLCHNCHAVVHATKDINFLIASN